MSTLIGIGLAILVIGLVVGGIVLMQRSEEDPLADRIGDFAARDEPTTMEDVELSIPFSDRVIVPIIRKISEQVIRLTPQSTLERTSKLLETAGSPRNMSAAEFWTYRAASTIILTVLTFIMISRFMDETISKRLLYTLIGGGLGFMLPQMLLNSMIGRRKDAIMKKLPDALDLMTICVDAGLTFDGAMGKVEEKWTDPLALEFGRVIHEIQLGKTRRQSLRDMSERMDVSDVTSFVASILQAEQLGVSIGKVLRIQSEQMRIKRRQRAEEKAHQAPVKMLFPMIFLIFPSVFVVLLGPAGLRACRKLKVQICV